ncbi:MAG: tetratricopeptide repeat protein [Saprospiraceae bacterium]
MSRPQYIAIGSTLVLFLVLYLGCETKPPGQTKVESVRALQAESTDVNVLIREAHDSLSQAEISTLQVLEQELSNTADDSTKIELLQQISGTWFQAGFPAIAGFYAQQVAETTSTEEAWSIAGTTYALCVQRETAEKVKSFCSQRAVTAFENAISLNPTEVRHRVNLALTYTDAPPTNDPMKGIMMLRELEQSFPESPIVYTTLARLAMKTGQFDRATQRLETALELQPDDLTIICQLAAAYEAAGQLEKAASFRQQCQEAAQ